MKYVNSMQRLWNSRPIKRISNDSFLDLLFGPGNETMTRGRLRAFLGIIVSQTDSPPPELKQALPPVCRPSIYLTWLDLPVSSLHSCIRGDRKGKKQKLEDIKFWEWKTYVCLHTLGKGLYLFSAWNITELIPLPTRHHGGHLSHARGVCEGKMIIYIT